MRERSSRGRGRESEIREWNVAEQPGRRTEVKVKVVADSAPLTHRARSLFYRDPSSGHRHRHLRVKVNPK